MYAAVLFIGVQNATSVQPVVAIERTVFYRERAAGMYSALPFAFGQVCLYFPHACYIVSQDTFGQWLIHYVTVKPEKHLILTDGLT